MLLIYRSLTFFLYPIFLIIIYFRKNLGKEDQVRFKEKVFSSSFLKSEETEKKLFWFHAASIGEILSIIPLVIKLSDNKNLNILITTVTLSSSNLVQNKLGKYKNIKHQFFPLDSIFLVKKFLDCWKPSLVCFVDSEIWPNFLIEIKKRNIPLALINARITKKTFMRWVMFKNLSSQVFSKFDLCLTANLESKNNLIKLGAKNIKYIGNLKFSVSNKISNMETKDKENLDDRIVWCAVSTHSGEEILCFKSHIKIKKYYNNLLTIVIPRHISRSKEISLEAKKLNLRPQILNEGELIDKNIDVLIINSFGNITKYFEYYKVVLIGKSMLKKFERDGGQNPIDAAKLGCKIFHGPYVSNFNEVYDLLKSYNISEQVNNYEDLAEKIINMFKSKNIKLENQSESLNMHGIKILNETINEIKNITKQ